ncbi:MFS transporter [Catenulispora yoronensis]|uniref:MFS transporter n=1 Tax=Catenulispora yoronensis TaxID=450799 RepID=A0ABP5G7R5_9ACTN
MSTSTSIGVEELDLADPEMQPSAIGGVDTGSVPQGRTADQDQDQDQNRTADQDKNRNRTADQDRTQDQNPDQAQPQQPAKRRSLWRHRDFRLLWVGETVSVLGSAVSGVALPLVALETMHAAPYIIGLMTAAAWLPWLVLGLPAGAWIDRLPRRRTLVAANAASFLLVLSVPVAWWLGVLTLGQLVAVELLGGAAGVFFGPALGAYIPSLLDPEDLPEGNAKLEGAQQAAVVSGGSLGGLLIQAVTAAFGLVVDAASYVVSTVCLLAIRKPEPERPGPRPDSSLRQEIRDGFRFLARDPYLRILTIGAAVDNFLLSGGQALLVVFLVRDLGLSAGGIGVLMAGDCLGGVVGALFAGRIARRLGTARALLTLSLASTPFGLLIPMATHGPGLALFALGLLIPAAGIVAVNVIGAAWRQAYCPPDMLGRIGSSGSVVSFCLIPLGALAGGALATVIGVRTTLWLVLGAGALAKAILLIGPLRTRRDLPESPNSGGLPAASEA